MPLARYKDLCIDATDPARMGPFWAAVLGLAGSPLDDGDWKLTGPTARHTVWVNRVPEPVTVKQRVHLDVYAGSVDEVVALGATVVDADSFRWTVLRDPDGGELCVFLRDPAPDYRMYSVVVDTGPDPHPIAVWWAGLLGGEVGDSDHGFSYVEKIPHMPYDGITFIPVPEPKTVKNRVHLDVETDDLDAVVASGATVLRAQDDEISWTVVADPEGNELCVFTR